MFIDLLREVVERVEKYDVYPYEKEKLEIFIIAPHDDSFRQAMEELIGSGYELSNIHFAYNPAANNATVTLDMVTNEVRILWRYEEKYVVGYGSDVENLGSVLKRIIRHAA